jgi:hypothetical protein
MEEIIMSKAENKTKATKIDPKNFIQTLSEKEQKIATELITIFEEATGWKCVMWGKIFGFGKYIYEYPSGRTGDFMATAFAMRSTGPVVYTIVGHGNYPEILEKLGKFKNSGKSCLSFKKLEDINISILKKLIQTSVKDLKKKYKVE